MSRPPAAPVDAPASRRSRAVRLTIGAAVGGKAVSVLCTFFQVPIAFGHLGIEAYGVWVTLLSLYSLFNFIDFGIGIGMQHQMARAFAEDDWAGVWRGWRMGLRCLLLIGLAGSVLALALVWTLDLAGWLRIADPELRQALPQALTLIVLGYLGCLPGNVAVRLAAAVQLGWTQGLWIGLGSILTTVAVWLAARAGGGFITFVAIIAIVPVAQGLAQAWHVRRRVPATADRWSRPPAEAWRTLISTSGLSAVPQFSQVLLQFLPPLALSSATGPLAVAEFNLLQRLSSPLTHGLSVLLQPLWPAYVEAQARQDLPWLRRSFQRSVLVTVTSMVVILAVCVGAQPLLRLWVGPEVPQLGRGMVWAAGGWFCVQLAFQPLLQLLLGTGRLRELAFHALVGGLAAVAALFAASARGGAVAGLVAGAVAYVLAGLVGMTLASRRALRQRPLP